MFTPHHVSHVTCHMSCVRCQVSGVRCHIFILFIFLGGTKWWNYSVEGLLSTGPTPSSCRTAPATPGLFNMRYSIWRLGNLRYSICRLVNLRYSIFRLGNQRYCILRLGNKWWSILIFLWRNFFLKLPRLLIKVTKGTTEYQKWAKTAYKAPKELEEGPLVAGPTF